MRNVKKKILVILVMVITIFCCSCGKKYTCSMCDVQTSKAYYDPFSEDSYFCEDCARSYFAPFPYSGYRVK